MNSTQNINTHTQALGSRNTPPLWSIGCDGPIGPAPAAESVDSKSEINQWRGGVVSLHNLQKAYQASQLTQWFDGNTPPVYNGVYRTKWNPNAQDVWFNRYCDGEWYFGSSTTAMAAQMLGPRAGRPLRWCGVAAEMTDWIDGTVMPLYPGVYECQWVEPSQQVSDYAIYSMFDGERWRLGSGSLKQAAAQPIRDHVAPHPLRWRALANHPYRDDLVPSNNYPYHHPHPHPHLTATVSVDPAKPGSDETAIITIKPADQPLTFKRLEPEFPLPLPAQMSLAKGRVQAELANLVDKLQQLDQVVMSPRWFSLSTKQRHLLDGQRSAMRQYRFYLEQRLVHWGA